MGADDESGLGDAGSAGAGGGLGMLGGAGGSSLDAGIDSKTPAAFVERARKVLEPVLDLKQCPGGGDGVDSANRTPCHRDVVNEQGFTGRLMGRCWKQACCTGCVTDQERYGGVCDVGVGPKWCGANGYDDGHGGNFCGSIVDATIECVGKEVNGVPVFRPEVQSFDL